MTALTDFFAAWTTQDPSSRRALIASAVADEFFYVDPMTPNPIRDIDGMDAYAANFLGMCPPGASVAVKEPVDAKLGHIRATVAFNMGPDTQQLGQYFADLTAEGKIIRMVGYAGKGAE